MLIPVWLYLQPPEQAAKDPSLHLKILGHYIRFSECVRVKCFFGS